MDPTIAPAVPISPIIVLIWAYEMYFVLYDDSDLVTILLGLKHMVSHD